MAFDVDDHIDALQMGRKRTVVGPPLGVLFPTLIARSLFILFQTVRLDLFGFFEPKEKLIFWKGLGSASAV